MDGKPDVSSLGPAVPLLSQTRQDVARVTSDLTPFLWAGKYLGWVPVHGGDLVQSDALLEMANALLICGDETSQGILPLWRVVYVQKQHPTMTGLSKLLVEAQPHLSNASSGLEPGG